MAIYPATSGLSDKVVNIDVVNCLLVPVNLPDILCSVDIDLGHIDLCDSEPINGIVPCVR